MLFGVLPLLLLGVGLTFLLDGGSGGASASGDDTQQPDTPPDPDTPPAPDGPLTLTPGDDRLDMATTDASEVDALGGNDTITANVQRPLVLTLGEGDDEAQVTNGFVEVDAGAGDDSVLMTDGALLAFLGLGNDTVEGIDGQIEAYGGDGDDLMRSSQFDDTLDGGAGNDTISTIDGENRLLGGAGDDGIAGGFDADTILGGEGNDTLDGRSGGDDILIGGSGDDLIETDGRGDTLFGYAGNDTLSAYSLSSLENDLPGAVLDGGTGDDDLMGDLNATMTGGEGRDDFTVVTEFGSLDSPAVIRDFNPSEGDRLFLTITPEFFGDPRDGPDYEVTRQLAADGGGVEILVNGGVYVTLEGLATLDGWTVTVRENFI